MWGKRRSTGDNDSTPDDLNGKTDSRGFTGHEMLEQLGLVHMNGRVYNPLIGKFLSADSMVNDPINGQSHNRYSYALNNPTNLVDPTGYSEYDPNGNDRGEPAKESSTGSPGDSGSSGSSGTESSAAQASAANRSTRNSGEASSASGNTPVGAVTGSSGTAGWNKPTAGCGGTELCYGEPGKRLEAANPVSYRALQITEKNGDTHLAMTKVKNSAQAKRFRLPIGASVPIPIPDKVTSPQDELKKFSRDVTALDFAFYWRLHGLHDYKTSNPMYDAYGNFQYGATGRESGFFEFELLGAAELIKGGRNDPQNNEDIRSGYETIQAGGSLGERNYTQPTSK